MFVRLRPYIILALLASVLLLPGISRVPLLDRDSAHFAQATKQMVETGNYFQIRFQERTRYQKPPGINWLQAAVVNTFSWGDLTQAWLYRLPSFIGGLLSLLLTFFFTHRQLGFKVALLATVILSSTLLLVVESHLAVIDASLLSSMVLMQGALWCLYSSRETLSANQSTAWAIIFWLAMSYGFVLKGVTPLVGLLTILTLCLVDRSRRPLSMTKPLIGLLIFAICASWVFAVSDAEGTNYLLMMINRDLLPKLQGGHESHGAPPLTHVAILPFTFWPGSLFLWFAGCYAYYHRHELQTKFLLAWLIPSWCVFELMPTKLPQYVLPMFPALAILAGLGILQVMKEPLTGRARTIHRILLILWIALSFFLAMALYQARYIVHLEFSWVALLFTSLIILLSCLCVYTSVKEKHTTSVIFVVLLSVISFAWIFSSYLPSLKPLWLTERVAQTIHQSPKLMTDLSEKRPLIAIGYEEPSLVFALGTKNVRYSQLKSVLKSPANTNQLVLLPHSELNMLRQSLATKNAVATKIARYKGLNYNKGHWLDLVLARVESKRKVDE